MMRSKGKTTGRLEGAIDAAEYLAEVVVNIVGTPRCEICRTNLAAGRRSPFREPPLESLLCPRCRKLLACGANRFCPRCALPVQPGKPCRCAAQGNRWFDEVRPLSLYTGMARSLAIGMKHSTRHRLAMMMGKLYRDARRRELDAFRPTCVAAVPMHWKRQYLVRRGVNSPAKIAKELAADLRVPCYSRYLRRVRATPAQTTVAWTERPNNVRGAFAVHDPKNRAPFMNQRVVLLDDAFTSGATTNEIAHVLKDAGAAAVFVAPLTRAGLRRSGAAGPDASNPPEDWEDDLDYYDV